MDRPRQLLAKYPPDYHYDEDFDPETADWQLEWDMFLEDVEENVMKPCLPEEGWIVVIATNLGWRNNHGWKIFRLDDVLNFVKNVSGFECDQTIAFYVDETMQITASVSHHDSPTGEGRSIVPLKEWIAREIQDLEIYELRANLRWIMKEEDDQEWKTPSDWYLWETAVNTGTTIKDFTKEDYVAIYYAYFEEGFIGDVDIFNLEGYILRHQD